MLRAEAAIGAGGAAAPGPAPESDPFAARIVALMQGFADGRLPDFAGASFAELFAWSLARFGIPSG